MLVITQCVGEEDLERLHLKGCYRGARGLWNVREELQSERVEGVMLELTIMILYLCTHVGSILFMVGMCV